MPHHFIDVHDYSGSGGYSSDRCRGRRDEIHPWPKRHEGGEQGGDAAAARERTRRKRNEGINIDGNG